MSQHGPKVVCYVGGPGEPYYKPHIQCICGWHTENGGPYTWEEAGAEFDEHLAGVSAKRRKAAARARERRAHQKIALAQSKGQGG